jgi:hypothetical protein
MTIIHILKSIFIDLIRPDPLIWLTISFGSLAYWLMDRNQPERKSIGLIVTLHLVTWAISAIIDGTYRTWYVRRFSSSKKIKTKVRRAASRKAKRRPKRSQPFGGDARFKETWSNPVGTGDKESG